MAFGLWHAHNSYVAVAVGWRAARSRSSTAWIAARPVASSACQSAKRERSGREARDAAVAGFEPAHGLLLRRIPEAEREAATVLRRAAEAGMSGTGGLLCRRLPEP